MRIASSPLAAGWRGSPLAFTALAAACGPLGAGLLLALAARGVLPVPAFAWTWQAVLLALVAAPALEELAFRGSVQDAAAAVLRRRGWRDASPLTLANVLTSLAFAACHLATQPAALAAAIFLPSLVFGRLRERWGSLWPPVLMHAWYNACLLAALAAVQR